MEIGEAPQPQPEKKTLSPEAIGPKIIGHQNPDQLTPEQFKKSPDLLFHGSSSPFKFSPDFDYSSSEYLDNNDGSQTLGEGFYLTPSKKAASDYSSVRQVKPQPETYVTEILPFEAKMLDLRNKHHLNENAPVSADFFTQWHEKIKQSHQTSSSSENTPWYIHEMEEEYLSYLEKLSSLPSLPDLRVMLGTTISPYPEIPTLNFPSPPWMKLFSEFIIEQGYDGLIYNEGSEKKGQPQNPSYIFYNLKKLRALN